ncbi:RnfH family protein [Psychrobacter lutiphocae]|uniref:RnfH family protein n=1 Tax=Psychrobacter lutiphocae TaxID=540500 RepID=UPI00037879DA|nr:RnfH family protein [Psychrobacter lutiphocae]
MNTVAANLDVNANTDLNANAKANSSQTASQAQIPISLAYAPTASEHVYLELEVAEGTHLYQALQLSGWLEKYPELKQWCESQRHATQVDNKQWLVGVYSQKKLLSYELQAHDRVEVYRPLSIDPMRKRKRRANRQ